MNTPRTLLLSAAGIALVGTLAIGGIASAAEPEDTSRPPRSTEWCDNLDTFRERAATADEKLDARLERLETALAKATEAGRERLIKRIELAIDRVQGAHDKLDTKVARIEAWAAENCSAA